MTNVPEMTVSQAIQILAGRRNGESDAAKQVHAWCLRALRNLRASPADAEEVAQELMMRIMTGGDSFASAERPEVFLRCALRNRLYDLYRSTHRMVELDELSHTDAEGQDVARGLARLIDGGAILRELDDLIERVIAKSKDPERDRKTAQELIELATGAVPMNELIDAEVAKTQDEQKTKPDDERKTVRLRLLKRHQRFRDRLNLEAGASSALITAAASLFIRCEQPKKDTSKKEGNT